MSVNAGSPLAKEWAREEIKKLNRLDLAEMEHDARKTCATCKGAKDCFAFIHLMKIEKGNRARAAQRHTCSLHTS